MGLRESLRDFFTMSAAAQGAAESTGALRKQLEMEAIGQELPSAIQSGDLSGVAGRAYGIGDPTLLREALGQQAAMAKAQGKPSDAPLMGDALRAAFPGMPDSWYAAAETAGSRDQQRQEFAALSTDLGRKEQITQREMDRYQRDINQREQSRERFEKSISGNLKKYRENQEAFERLGSLDPNVNVEFWPLVSTIIKKVGMDAGALSDQDMQRFIKATGQKTLTSALQYIGAIDPSKNPIDSKTIAAVQQTIQKMKAYSDQKLKERAQNELQKQVSVRGERLDDDLVKELALDYGFVANKKDGKWQFGDEIEVSKERIDLDTKGAKDTGALIQRVKDPERQAKYLKALQKGGGTLPPQIMQALEKEVQ